MRKNIGLYLSYLCRDFFIIFFFTLTLWIEDVHLHLPWTCTSFKDHVEEIHKKLPSMFHSVSYHSLIKKFNSIQFIIFCEESLLRIMGVINYKTNSDPDSFFPRYVFPPKPSAFSTMDRDSASLFICCVKYYRLY